MKLGLESSSDNGSPVESDGVQPNLLLILSLWTQLEIYVM